MNKNYLQLEFSTGLFFIYSGEEKQGYDKHTSTKGNVSYRKYFKDGVTGVLESVSIFDGRFGKQISMTLKNGNDIYYLPVDISDQKGSVDTYAESLIKLLPNLEKGENLTVRGYNFTPEGEQYAKIGISISKDGEKIKTALTNSYYKGGELVEGDIPALVWKENALGKKKPSASSQEAKDDYLLEVLKRETERLKWESGSSNQQQPKTAKGDKKEEEYDELPF